MSFDISRIKARLDGITSQAAGREVKVGWPKGKEYPDGTPVAYVAAIQNFGAPERGIPPRPILKPAIAQNKDRWGQIADGMVGQMVRDQVSGFDVLDTLGRTAALDLQAFVGQITEPELSPVTVLLRQWRKEGRAITGKTVGEAAQAIKDGVVPGSDNKPLNDTGYLIASIGHAVGIKGSGNFEAS
jgi:hypothetical protein